MDFETYLISKKIDSAVFQKAEPILWDAWKIEFDQMHPASFTAQKLYLINPIRRKYQLKHEPIKEVALAVEKPAESATNLPTTSDQPPKPPSPAKPVVPRPVFKPKPKTS